MSVGPDALDFTMPTLQLSYAFKIVRSRILLSWMCVLKTVSLGMLTQSQKFVNHRYVRQDITPKKAPINAFKTASLSTNTISIKHVFLHVYEPVIIQQTFTWITTATCVSISVCPGRMLITALAFVTLSALLVFGPITPQEDVWRNVPTHLIFTDIRKYAISHVPLLASMHRTTHDNA